MLTMSRKCRGVDLPDLEMGVLAPDMVEDAGRDGRACLGAAKPIYRERIRADSE